MILHSIDAQHSADELEFRKYLIGALGEADAERLVLFSWENSISIAAYMNALAHIVRGVGQYGASFVHHVLEVAWKPKEQREAEIELSEFGYRLVHDLTQRIMSAVNEDRPKLAEECYLEMCHRVREKLREMWPNQPDYVVNGALIAGCHHHKDRGCFEIDQVKLVNAMLAKDPLS